MMTRSIKYASNLTKRRQKGHTWLGTIAVLAALLQIGIARAEPAFDLENYTGQVVLIDFWASWCGPCRQSFPWMNTMQSKYSDDGLVIVAVNVDNDLAAANRFLADFPAKFQIHFDADKTLAHEYEVVAMPSSFLIGRDGHVVKKHMGFKVLKQDEYEAAIRTALDLEN